MVIGGTVGVLTGYFGGRTDSVLMRVADYFLVIPDVPLMVVMAALFGRSLRNIVLIIALIYWASTARLIRAQTRSIKERVFVRRARAIGAGHLRVLLSHVVPQIVPLLIANTVLQIALGHLRRDLRDLPRARATRRRSRGARSCRTRSRPARRPTARGGRSCRPGLCVTLVVIGFTLVGQTVEEEPQPAAAGRPPVLPPVPGAAEAGVT